MMKSYGRSRTARAIALMLATLLLAASMPVSILAYDDSDVRDAIKDVENRDDSAASSLNEDGSSNTAVGEKQSVDIAVGAVQDAQQTTDAANGTQSSDLTSDLLKDLTDPGWSEDNTDERIMPADQAAAATGKDLGDLDKALLDKVMAESEAYVYCNRISDQMSRNDWEYVLDENGDPVLEPLLDENGQPVLDLDGNPVFVAKMTPVVKDVKNKTEQANTDADLAIQNAERANKTASEKEAIEASKTAKADLQRAKEGLGEAESELVKAENRLKEANIDYLTQKTKFDTAKSKSEEAQKNALEGAVKDSAAAAAALAAAEQKLSALAQEMTQAYRNILESGYGKVEAAYNALYGEDGFVTKNPDNYEDNDTYRQLARKLCNSIIEYQILKDEKVTLGGDIIFTDLIERYDEDGTEQEGDLIWQKYKAVKFDYVKEENENGMTDGWVSYADDTDPDKGNCVKATIYSTDENGDIIYDDKGIPVVKETKYYSFSKDDDGKICIFERGVSVEQERTVEKKDAVAGVEGYPAHFESDGVTYDETQYTHSAELVKDGKTVALYAIDDDESRRIGTKDNKIFNEVFYETVPNGGLIRKLRVYTETSEAVRTAYTAIEPEEQDQTPSILKSEEKKYDVTEYTCRGTSDVGYEEHTYYSREEAERRIADNTYSFMLDYEIKETDNGQYILCFHYYTRANILDPVTHQEYKTIKETMYRADDFDYVPGEEHVDKVIGNKQDLYVDKVVWTPEGSAPAASAANGTPVTKEQYEEKLSEYREQLSAYRAQSEAYQKALKEVSAAKQRADAIKEKVDALYAKGVAEVDSVSIDALEKKLADAQTAYDNAKNKVEDLSGKVAKAKKAVESINLSRFYVEDGSDTDKSSDEASPSSDRSGFIAEVFTDLSLLPALAFDATGQKLSGAGRGAGRNAAASAADIVISNELTDLVNNAGKSTDTGIVVSSDAGRPDAGQVPVKVESSIVPLVHAPLEEETGYGYALAVSLAAAAGGCAAAAYFRLRRFRENDR